MKSGKVSDFYIDVKNAYGDLELLERIADKLYVLMGTDVNCIAAQGYGGLPVQVAIAERFSISNLTFVRDKPKEHGLGGLLDGHVPGITDVVAIVDDVGSSGQSLVESIEAIRPTGAKIEGCYTVIKRGNFVLPYNIPYLWLYTPEDLMRGLAIRVPSSTLNR